MIQLINAKFICLVPGFEWQSELLAAFYDQLFWTILWFWQDNSLILC